MVGIQAFPIGEAYFQGRTASFREGMYYSKLPTKPELFAALQAMPRAVGNGLISCSEMKRKKSTTIWVLNPKIGVKHPKWMVYNGKPD